MKVYFHPDCYSVYTGDPAAAAGRMEAIVSTIAPHVDILSFSPATESDLQAAHPKGHIESIRNQGLYDIAALAAGGAIQFCYFNNMAVSLYRLQSTGRIETAFILDFDLHYGDGNVNILGSESWIDILNPESYDRQPYLEEVKQALDDTTADVIAVSAGFDNHAKDWGGLLSTADYRTMGRWIRETALRNHGGCYGILEGGYNHEVLGGNVLAFIEGLDR